MNGVSVITPTEWDFQHMAWHEAGHAVAALFLPEREAVLRVSIQPGDGAFGFMQTAQRPHLNESDVSLRSAISVELSGLLSERIFLSSSTTGGGADLQMAYRMAFDMVVRFGMGTRSGLACPGNVSDEIAYAFASRNCLAVDADIAEIIAACQKQAENVLSANGGLVRAVAMSLLEKRTLTTADLDALRSTSSCGRD